MGGPKVFVPGTGQFLNSTCIRTNQSSEGIRFSAELTERIRRQRTAMDSDGTCANSQVSAAS